MTLSTPAQVILRLEEIENELAEKQNALEDAAHRWFLAKRDKEHKHAIEFRKSQGTVAERSAWADEVTAMIGSEHEALYEALKVKVRLLEARATIGQSILRSQSRS